MNRDCFYDLADFVGRSLARDEVYLANLSGERTDFCRLNGAKVRQAGTVEQAAFGLRLICGKKSANGSVALSGTPDHDRSRLVSLLAVLREQVSQLPDDPYLLYSTEVHSSEKTDASQLPDSPGVIARIVESVRGLDMVGIYAAGGMMRGFANSFGQKNWFETYSFHLDWSFYLRADKAVKSSYAGLRWNDHEFVAKVDRARLQWEVLKREPRTIEPGRYRVYLSPSAIEELTGVMSWGGFGLKSHKTKQTPLMKLADGTHTLHPSVTLREHTQGGLSPDFNEFGYVKPSVVTLIENGVYKDCLVSPRSAVEYDVPTNGAGTGEIPQSLEMISGDLAMEDAEVALGEGVYVNNLWYLNFSDRSAGRVTGMTRFATFWVEGGKISQPLNVMRFDESLIKLFGENLLSLTKERELLLSASTYGHRTTDSSHLPGALVKDFSFTL